MENIMENDWIKLELQKKGILIIQIRQIDKVVGNKIYLRNKVFGYKICKGGLRTLLRELEIEL